MNTYLTASSLLTWPTKLAQSRLVVRAVVPGDPKSKQRPRFTRNRVGTYTPKQTVDAEMDIQVCIKGATPFLFPDDVGRYGLRCLFVQKNAQRRDVDNMMKLVMDACSGLVWADDTQVTEITAKKIVIPGDPRTEIVIYRSDAPDAATRACENCGNRFRLYPSWQRKRYCSRACATMGRQAAIPRTAKPCASCGKEIVRPVKAFSDSSRHYFCNRGCKAQFGRITLSCANCLVEFSMPRSLHKAGQPACSLACRVSIQRTRQRINARGVCEKCEGPTTKKQYISCRACRWLDQSKGVYKKGVALTVEAL